MTSLMRQIARCARAAGAGLGLLIGLGDRAEAGQTYLALGDSITFGVQQDDSALDVSNGDRGYVAGYADVLAARAGGVRPNVINLAVSGETSSSFFGNGVSIAGPGASIRNTNYAAGSLPPTYTGPSPPSQDALMLATIAAQRAAGNTISTVTLTLGANDLFAKLAQGQNPFDALDTFKTNEARLLGQIRALLPNANLILLNYFDPYAPFTNYPDPTGPYYQLYQIAQISALVIPALNQDIRDAAATVGASYVDLYHPFQGRELADTYIASGNVHPNDAGYALISAAISVPEPGSVALLGVGLLAAAVTGRRRRARTAA